MRSVGQRDGRVEVRSRNRPEGENQRDQHGAGGERIGQQRDGDVAAGQPLAHDAGADHSRQQEGRPERLSYSTPDHSTPSRPVSRRG